MINEKKIINAASNYANKRCEEDEELSFNQLLDAFEDGANWVLDNLWHDASEEPKHGLILVEFHDDRAFRFMVYQSKEYIKLIFVKHWLYIEDLIKGTNNTL